MTLRILIAIAFLWIPSLSISQNIDEGQLRRIFHGLQEAEIEHQLLEAFVRKDKINDSLIKSKDREIGYLKEQIAIQSRRFEMEQSKTQSKDLLIDVERRKRFGIGPAVNFGYGTGSKNAQIFVGLGINYNFLKF